MPPLVLLSPAPGVGKTTVAVALSRRLSAQGRSGALSRLGEGDSAAADSALFSRLSAPDGEEIIEAPGGALPAIPGASALVVADGAATASDISTFVQSTGDRLVGVVLNRVPEKRRERLLGELEGSGIKPLVALAEDRMLATPTLGEVASTLDAQTSFYDSNAARPLDRVLIAPISADPGQGYFSGLQANAVIVRSDKPDLQLAALNAGATCLIVTGELPLLGYVTERAEADEIPIVRTQMETPDAVRSIEGLFGAGPFSGSPEKLSRLAELIPDFDATRLFAA